MGFNKKPSIMMVTVLLIILILFGCNNKTYEVARIPAMPEKGFHWDYFLRIPSDKYKQANKDFKRYLMIDIINSGVKDYDESLKWVEKTLTMKSQYSVTVAEQLWIPMIMPVFPRTNLDYYYNNENNKIYEHSLDRDIATLHKKLENSNLRKILTDKYENNGYDVNKFVHLDRQLLAMIDHAIEYLNSHEHNIENDRVFLCGYSASGTFTDRFANLHPARVKAIASGATLDDMMLPLSNYKGENLIFPIGTYDYEDITDRKFDLTEHNKVARLIYMGEDDDNNVVPFSDCYGDKERNIIDRLWGIDVLPRAKSLIQLYGQSGGKGMFILDKDVAHDTSRQMKDYVLEFFKANRDTENPVYPIPDNSNQLEYKLYD